jgi:hypothetical protein
MHSRTTAIALTIALLTPSTSDAQQPTVGSLRWLNGCWERTTRTGRAFEHWVAGPQELMGYARVITDARDRETEHLRIYRRGDTLVYEAHPVDQALTIFPLRSHSADSLVFENPAHDFPQRIAYKRTGDSLIALVSNITGGGRPLRFAFRKAAECPAPSAASVTEARIAATLRAKYDTLMARELRSQGEFSQWFADNGEPGFTLRAWASSGFGVPTVDRDSYARNAEAFRNRTNAPSLRDRRYDVTIDRMLVRGDTAEVMVTTRASWYFNDTAGTFGDAGKEHHRASHDRRIDTWVQSDGVWRLRLAELISTELSIDGRVTQRNGARVQP